MKRFIGLFLSISLVLALCACVGGGEDETEGYSLNAAGDELIVDDAGVVTVANEGNCRTYYQIFVGSFSDSDGDGIGDLRGIIERFDYLNDGDDNSGLSLGVEGIWLSPIFTSPSYHKYDTENYYEIDPDFGTMEDLQELIDLCHERNVQIILDFVINHTSTGNAWFKDFVNAHKYGLEDDFFYNYYSWSDEKLSGATYATISGTSQYYECNFSNDMPELNFDNPDVRQEILNIAKYYLNMGVDGFRFDAAKYVYYGDEAGNGEFWDWFMAELRAIKPDIFTVAEVWSADGATYPYFTATNCFNFTLAQTSGTFASVAKGGNVDGLTGYIQSYVETITALREDAFMCVFLANHDMDRAAGYMTVSSGAAYVAANISVLTPGATFIYYGDEIGMLGSRGGASTDANRRLAMLWGDGDTVKNPVGATYNAEQVNGTVAEQRVNENSLYTHYKKLIAIRKANPEIAYGSYTALKLSDTKAGGFVCTHEGSSVLVLHNPTTEAVQIDLSALTDVAVTVISAYAGLGGATLNGTVLTLDGQTSAVLR